MFTFRRNLNKEANGIDEKKKDGKSRLIYAFSRCATGWD